MMWPVVCFNFAIRSLYVVSKVVGLAPISVNFENFSIQAAGRWASLRSMLLLVPLAIVYPISWYTLSRRSSEDFSKLQHPDDEISTTNMNSTRCMVQYAAGYVVLVMISIMQMGRRENSVEFLRGTATLYHKLPSIFSDTACNYQLQQQPLVRVSMCKNLVALFLLKSILFGMILLTATWFNLNSHFEGILTLSTFLHSLVLLSPTLLMLTLSNGFYGASLLLAFYLMLLNRKLSRITEELSTISSVMLSQSADKGRERHPRFALHQLHFSDEIDNIAILYGEVVKYIAKLHENFTLSVLLIITHSFMNIILELFLIYLALATENASTNYTRVAMQLFFVLLNYLEIFFVVEASMSSQKQMDKTLFVLNKFHSSCLEGRLEESIEILFMQMLQQYDNVKIRPCGLFPVDYTLITSIMCSICSYLVISVQFYMMH